jgi:ribosomal protein L11 methyltransferase
MKQYLEISVSATEQQRELLIPTMIELGCSGFQETETELLCYIDKVRLPDEQLSSFQDEVKRILLTISMNAEIKFRIFDEENWNEQWERSLQPVEVGSKIVVKPSWTSYDNREHRIVLQIDPKMSFGTGYHETTRLTLLFLEKYIRNGMDILDVGTGTGVLAIAAVKLGASHASGTDIDEWSILNANENVIANDLANTVEISGHSLNDFTQASYDLITANLTLNTNVEMLHEFHRILKNDGLVLLSGLLSQDEQSMKIHLHQRNFVVIETINENEWIAIAAKRLQ